LEIPKGKGVLKAKILEAKCEAKLEFLGGGCKTEKKTSMGRVKIFSGTTHNNFYSPLTDDWAEMCMQGCCTRLIDTLHVDTFVCHAKKKE